MLAYNEIARHQTAYYRQAQRRKEFMQQIIADRNRNAPAASKRTYKVEEIANILDIGRSSAYHLVRQGSFKTVRIGTSIRVSKKSFDDWLDRQNL